MSGAAPEPAARYGVGAESAECGSRAVLSASRVLAACALSFLLVLFAPSGVSAATTLTSGRIWPAEEYTRLTLEAPAPIRYAFLTLKNPERVVLDLEDVELDAVLQGLGSKVQATDPYVQQVRVGRFKPGVVRLVLDLKTEVRANVFTLPPVGEYGHRLVLDIYPAQPVDPLLALVDPAEQKPDAAEAVPGADTPIEETGPVRPEAEKPASPEQVVPPAPVTEKPTPDKRRGKGKSPLARQVIIAIDAGHGGEDPGARGARGTHEKDVTLAIARRLKAKVDAEPGMRGVLIRDGDYFIPLHQRVAKARRVRADLFVSIHADAFIAPHARGSSVFALSESGATSAAAQWLAQKENESDLIGGVNLAVKDPYLAKTLLDLSQTATINDSLKLGKAVLSELGEINALHKASVEQAGFAVLKAPDIPSILVETAFITNPEEERKLINPGYQDKMAGAILSGIKSYFARNPPLARPRLARYE